MKIIKEGLIANFIGVEFKCNYCHCVFSLEPEDKIVAREHKVRGDIKFKINCPKCETNILFAPKGNH